MCTLEIWQELKHVLTQAWYTDLCRKHWGEQEAIAVSVLWPFLRSKVSVSVGRWPTVPYSTTFNGKLQKNLKNPQKNKQWLVKFPAAASCCAVNNILEQWVSIRCPIWCKRSLQESLDEQRRVDLFWSVHNWKALHSVQESAVGVSVFCFG